MNFKSLFRRFFPAVQRSMCSECGQLIIERRRKPCIWCGSLNRSLSASTEDIMQFKDKA